VTNFSDWPEWLKVLVLVPHGILASVVAYLLVFYVVMRYVFQMRDFK
jgi:hypothetical protein